MSRPSVIIRRANSEDVEALQQILNEVIADGLTFVYEDVQSIEQTRQMWLVPPVVSYVACDETSGEVLGAYLIKPNFPGRGSHIANATYMVKSSQRGRGIGRQLGLHSLEMARQAGYRAMQFNAVVSANTAAVTLWQSIGFTRIGTVPNGFRMPDGRYVDLYIMYQPL